MYILCFVFCSTQYAVRSTQYAVRTSYVHNDRVCVLACLRSRRLDKCKYEHYKWSVVIQRDRPKCLAAVNL